MQCIIHREPSSNLTGEKAPQTLQAGHSWWTDMAGHWGRGTAGLPIGLCEKVHVWNTADLTVLQHLNMKRNQQQLWAASKVHVKKNSSLLLVRVQNMNQSSRYLKILLQDGISYCLCVCKVYAHVSTAMYWSLTISPPLIVFLFFNEMLVLQDG